MRRIAIAAALALAAACSPKSDQDASKAGNADANVSMPTVDPSRVPERYTIVTRHSGAQTGTSTQHVRDRGRRTAMIEDKTTLVATGMQHRTRMRVIAEPASDGALRTIIIDLDTGQATSTTLPAPDVAQTNTFAGTLGKQMFSGGRRTGEKGSFAGHDCEYWEIPEPSMRFCFSPLGFPLYSRVQVAGMTMESTVTEVRLGDGGPDSAFAYDASRVVEQTGMQDMMTDLTRR